MKPLHMAVAAAVLLVTALVALMATSGGGRGETRRAGGDATTSPREGGAAEAALEPGADGVNAGSGLLSITLKIVDPEGAPAGGAEVELDRGIDALRLKADAEGKLGVRGLAAGIYDLRARRGNLAGALHFELRRTTDLGTLELSAAVTVRGHVYGPRGEPLKGARVEACRAAERTGDVMAMVRGMVQAEEVVARTAAREDGAYELVLPAGGTYGLRATAPGFAQEGEPARLYAADADGIDFWLLPGALLEGRVLDPRQEPVAGARVLVADPMGLFGRRVPKAETATAADGAFSMVVAPAQRSMLIVRAAGYASHMQANLQLPQTNLVVVLEEGVSLRLEAVDAERPEIPAPHVSVIAMYKGGFAAGETDDLGRLLIENLPTRGSGMGGQQQLFVWGGGFIAQTVDLGRNEPKEGVIDLGVVKLAPGGVVRGRVLDKSTGEPIAGARVRTFGGIDPQLEFFGSVPAASAADGSFRLTGVPLGAHTLFATHPDFVSDVDPMALFGGMGGGAGGPPLFPEGSRDVEKDVEMAPAESVTGIVLAPDGSPVAGASVAETGEENLILSRMLGGGTVAATSDATGAFVLKGVKPGREVKVSATHRDYGPSEEERARGGSGEPVTLRLAEPLAIQGVVVDERGEAVMSVRVQARRAASRSPRAPLDTSTARPSVTDEKGRYLLRNVPAGDLSVTFDHPDFALLTTQVTLTASRDLGRTALSRGGTIAGDVVDADGRPVADISVQVWSQTMASEGGGRTNGSAVTDENGRFTVRGLAEGEYRLRTWDRNYYAVETGTRTGATDARLVLKAAAKFVGRVTGRGLPVAGASVRAQRENTFLGWTRTGSDGTFVMDSLPPDEAFDVSVSHDAFRELKVAGVRASERTQDFVLLAGAEVSGRVVDVRGRGVERAQVEVRVGGKTARTVSTDATGAFTAGGLEEGQIEVRLEESNQGFVPTEWTGVATGARDVRLVATPGESIAGVVRDREGNPVRQVSLQAIDAAGVPVASTWIWQEDGVFELRGLRPGTYTVRVQRFLPGQQPAPPPRDVAGIVAGTKNVEIKLE